MVTAIWRDRTARYRQAMLLLMEPGKWGPEVAIAKRMINLWKNLVARGLWATDLHEYLEHGRVLRRSGPTGWLRLQLQRWGVRVDAEGVSVAQRQLEARRRSRPTPRGADPCQARALEQGGAKEA